MAGGIESGMVLGSLWVVGGIESGIVLGSIWGRYD